MKNQISSRLSSMMVLKCSICLRVRSVTDTVITYMRLSPGILCFLMLMHHMAPKFCKSYPPFTCQSFPIRRSPDFTLT